MNDEHPNTTAHSGSFCLSAFFLNPRKMEQELETQSRFPQSFVCTAVEEFKSLFPHQERFRRAIILCLA